MCKIDTDWKDFVVNIIDSLFINNRKLDLFLLRKYKLVYTILRQMLLIKFVLYDSFAAMFIGMLAFEGQVIQHILLNPRKPNNGLASALLIAFVSSVDLHLAIWCNTVWQALGAINGFTFIALKRHNSHTVANEAGKIIEKVLRAEDAKFKVIFGEVKLVYWL